jgi:fucose permease
MQSELAAAWGGNHIGTIISAYYVAYALMALVAGVLLDRYGAKRTIPLGIAVVGVGCIIFAQGTYLAGLAGFVIQALGAIFSTSHPRSGIAYVSLLASLYCFWRGTRLTMQDRVSIQRVFRVRIAF